VLIATALGLSTLALITSGCRPSPLIIVVALLVQEGKLRVVLAENAGPELHKVAHDRLDLLEVRVSQLRLYLGWLLLRLGSRQCSRHDKRVADLPPIPRTLALWVGIAVVCCEPEDVAFDHYQGLLSACFGLLPFRLPQAINVDAEYALDLAAAQPAVVEDQVNARRYGLVDLADAVGSKEEDALVILELPKEDCSPR
jgi:hypothetical protein